MPSNHSHFEYGIFVDLVLQTLHLLIGQKNICGNFNIRNYFKTAQIIRDVSSDTALLKPA